MPPLSRYIDLHCERIQDGLFEEPLNTLTSLLFIPLAVMLWRQLAKQPNRPAGIVFLIIMVALIGIGSAVFHTTARMWGALADALPIAIFALGYLYLFNRHVLGFRLVGILLSVAIFIAANVIFKMNVHKAPDGYLSLIPTLVLYLFYAFYMLAVKNPSGKITLLAAVLALMAINFRIYDRQLCEQITFGTHFMWHSLMAIFCYLGVREVIKHYRFYQK